MSEPQTPKKQPGGEFTLYKIIQGMLLFGKKGESRGVVVKGDGSLDYASPKEDIQIEIKPPRRPGGEIK